MFEKVDRRRAADKFDRRIAKAPTDRQLQGGTIKFDGPLEILNVYVREHVHRSPPNLRNLGSVPEFKIQGLEGHRRYRARVSRAALFKSLSSGASSILWMRAALRTLMT